MAKFKVYSSVILATGLLVAGIAQADQMSATIQALRMAGVITGGNMPSSAPEFAQMVTSIQAGDYQGAAAAAVGSKYFAAFLPRRMAKQMMTPKLSEAGVIDNDATTFIVANLIGSGTTPSISSLWSQNATYLVKVGTQQLNARDLTATQLAAVNWKTDLVKVAGQTVMNFVSVDGDGNETYNAGALPAAHVGGYLTLNTVSQGGNGAKDGSFAQYSFTAGTNLRAVEGMYEIALGLTLPQMIVTVGATSQVVPRFVPKNNPSFTVGQGQPACISCHGGGVSNLTHGYAAFADIFNFKEDIGLTYRMTGTTNRMKSYGSDADKRDTVKTCNLSSNPPPSCNPDGPAASATQAWDLTTWRDGGLLAQMGWTGAITGQGLNTLGLALGKATLVYEFLVRRVIKEICPLGSMTEARIAEIRDQAKIQDSFPYIVTQVAADPSCY